jgi:hypothetical protein
MAHWDEEKKTYVGGPAPEPKVEPASPDKSVDKSNNPSRGSDGRYTSAEEKT